MMMPLSRIIAFLLLLAPSLVVAFVSSPSTLKQQRCRKNGFQQTATTTTDDEFTVGILGDLHLDPRKMNDEYETARKQWISILQQAQEQHKGNVALVSLGDLGESQNCQHNPNNPFESFAGTTACHKLAAEYLSSFGDNVPYEVIGGDHDLAGLDEFATDQENLQTFLDCHNKDKAQFCRQIADKTLLVGLGSTVFREAKYTSHEVLIDDKQIAWFEQTLRDHPAVEGWKVIVFTHAPPNGSGLRVLQKHHVVNGCCWLNHSDELNCRKFIELVREHRCVKAWFSAHFHLGQDYQDSITFPTVDPKDGPYPNRGSCVFAQTSVIREGTSQDGHRQSRLIRGNKDGFEICTVDHKRNGEVRVDATITYTDDNHEVGVYTHDDYDDSNNEKASKQYNKDYLKVYAPCAGDNLHPPDDGYIRYDEDGRLRVNEKVTPDTTAWWRLANGRVLGMLEGMLVEYDSTTLAPLGLVVGADELIGKNVVVIDSGPTDDEVECVILDDDEDDNMLLEGYECASVGPMREQAVVMYDEQDGSVVVIQPNNDGSYWRKIVRNNVIRMQEIRRINAAKRFANEILQAPEGKEKVISSWGPYRTTSGTAKYTGVAGLTSPASALR